MTQEREKPSRSFLTDSEVLSKQESKANSCTARDLKLCFKQNLMQKRGQKTKRLKTIKEL